MRSRRPGDCSAGEFALALASRLTARDPAAKPPDSLGGRAARPPAPAPCSDREVLELSACGYGRLALAPGADIRLRFLRVGARAGARAMTDDEGVPLFHYQQHKGVRLLLICSASEITAQGFGGSRASSPTAAAVVSAAGRHGRRSRPAAAAADGRCGPARASRALASSEGRKRIARQLGVRRATVRSARWRRRTQRHLWAQDSISAGWGTASTRSLPPQQRQAERKGAFGWRAAALRDTAWGVRGAYRPQKVHGLRLRQSPCGGCSPFST
jgi:hypothetical protein